MTTGDSYTNRTKPQKWESLWIKTGALQESLDKLGIIVHTWIMKEIRRSSVYTKWLKALRDHRARSIIFNRTKRLAEGNPGDAKPVGEGISEMRIDYGQGYRIYYKDTGKEIIVLLCGGDKTTQQADITNAKKIARLYEEE